MRPGALSHGDSVKQPRQKLLDSEISSQLCTSPSSKPLPEDADAVALHQGRTRSLPELGQE